VKISLLDGRAFPGGAWGVDCQSAGRTLCVSSDIAAGPLVKGRIRPRPLCRVLLTCSLLLLLQAAFRRSREHRIEPPHAGVSRNRVAACLRIGRRHGHGLLSGDNIMINSSTRLYDENDPAIASHD
jgi:hypothetical protein